MRMAFMEGDASIDYDNAWDVAFSTGYDLRSGAGRVMADGRVGLVLERVAIVGSPAANDMCFVYCDDQADIDDPAAWTLTPIPDTVNLRYWFEFYSIPDTAGEGWACVGHHRTRQNVEGCYTLDNGDTWTRVQDLIPNADLAPGENPSEIALCQLGDTERWVGVIRSNDADYSAIVVTTTDLMDPLAYTSQKVDWLIGNNPPYMWYDPLTDMVHLNVQSRNDKPGADLEHILIGQSVDAEDLWADPFGAWPGVWERLSTNPSMTQMLGYMSGTWLSDGTYVTLFAATERKSAPEVPEVDRVDLWSVRLTDLRADT